MLGNFRKFHFIGIAGIGMCGIAEILLNMNYRVSGSDKSLSEVTDRLKTLGAEIFKGHSASNIGDADVVVYTAAVSPDNPELREAKKRGIPAIKRAEMLGELIRLQYGIGVAGTHGKTTTTGMVGLTLKEGGFDPTIIVGGRLKEFDGGTAISGRGRFSVVEADEFDRSFLKINPVITVVTNIEKEHLDTYKDFDDIKATFAEFVNKIPFYGFSVLCSDDPGVKSIMPFIKGRKITYGFNLDADIFAYDIRQEESVSVFRVDISGNYFGELKLTIPGNHNIKNSLAAIAIAKELGIDYASVRSALEKFRGVYRRFEIKATINDIIIIDDYAHHPTEVSATLSALRSGWKRRIVAVFQPHLFSRTRDFYKEFADVFMSSDVFICTDVYPARELPIPGVSGELITNAAIKNGHKNVLYVNDKNRLTDQIIKLIRPGDIVITLGAGDIYKYGEELISILRGRK